MEESDMRYEVFDESWFWETPDHGSQEHMERAMKVVTQRTVEQRPISFNDLLNPVFEDCSMQDASLTLRFHTEPWMGNTGGNMHGGMVAAICDLTMGLLVRYFKEMQACVTVHLSTEYARGVTMTGDVLVKATLEKAGRNIYFATAKVYRTSDGQMAALASAEFM